MKRTRLSFLHKKHKNTLSHGTITPTAAALLSATHIDTSSQPSQPNRTESNSSATQPKDDRDSIASNNKKDDETPPTSPEDAEPQKRKGVFGRWKE